MAINSYATLLTAVENWLAREDLTDRIPEFISLAEAKFNRSLRCYQMEKRATSMFVTTNDEPEFISLPSDFQSMRRIRLSSVNGKPQLEYKSQVALDEYRQSISNVTGKPRYFTIFGNEIEFCPTPDDSYTVEMVYRSNVPALSDANTTNWLILLAPDAYLYGSLLEAAPYIKEDERIATWATGLTTVIDGLNGLTNLAAFNAGPLIVRASGATP